MCKGIEVPTTITLDACVHDVWSSFPWRQLAQSWKVDTGFAQSMVIVIAEDAGQCVLGMDSSSARSISVGFDEI